MMGLFNSPFLNIFFEESGQFLKIVWLPQSIDMDEQDFKAQIEGEKNALLACQAKKILADGRNFAYIITPDLQDWHNDFLFPTFRSLGVSRLAVLISDDIFAQLSVEQLIADELNPKFITRYFDDESHATKWLGEVLVLA